MNVIDLVRSAGLQKQIQECLNRSGWNIEFRIGKFNDGVRMAAVDNSNALRCFVCCHDMNHFC